jgi:hypothetical protein
MKTRIKSILLKYRLLTDSLVVLAEKALGVILFVVSVAVMVLMLVHLGYDLRPFVKIKFYNFYNLSLFILSIGGLFYYFIQNTSQNYLSKVGKLDIVIHSSLLIASVLYFLIKPYRIAAIGCLGWIVEYNIIYISFSFILIPGVRGNYALC